MRMSWSFSCLCCCSWKKKKKDHHLPFFFLPRRHNQSVSSGGQRWTGAWLPSHLEASQVLHPHPTAHCVDDKMSAADKWNGKLGRKKWGEGCHISQADWRFIFKWGWPQEQGIEHSHTHRMRRRKLQKTRRQYLHRICILSSLWIVHLAPGCIKSCIKELSGKWVERQNELRIAERIITHQVSYYWFPLRNLRGLNAAITWVSIML